MGTITVGHKSMDVELSYADRHPVIKRHGDKSSSDVLQGRRQQQCCLTRFQDWTNDILPHGDDGYYQAGVAPASPRFTDNGNGTVFDNQTGLMWALDANMAGTNNTWDAAIDYCNDLVHGDHDDWRLPNVNELLSLIDHNPEEGWRYPQLPIGHPFLNVQTMPAYWSSTCGEDFIMGVESYYVYIGSGSAAQGEWTTDYAGCVWPVRGGR